MINETGETNQDLFVFTPSVFFNLEISFFDDLIWFGEEFFFFIGKYTHIVVCERSSPLWK